ncbi:MAG: DUF2934 domain-containing protein [Nitrospirae bacterium]|nr:DUF2934 domain-containing protein [Nitrospirota bacterium]
MELSMNNLNMQDEIPRVAAQLYQYSGCIEGRDLENWVAAERILRSGEEFCDMFMQMLIQKPIAASKLMEAVKLLIDLEEKQQLDKLIESPQ